MAHYVRTDGHGNIVEEYDYPDPIPFYDEELKAAIEDFQLYIDSLPVSQRTGLGKLFRILDRIAVHTGLKES